jgi:hypothetical protein
MVIVDRLFHSRRTVVKKGSINYDCPVRASGGKKLFPVRQSLGGDCMKKIIAISVMFALFAGAVFADTSISGSVETRMSLFRGSNVEDSKFATTADDNVGMAEGKLNLRGTNDDGNMGGAWTIKQANPASGQSVVEQYWVWWKPVEQIQLFLGKDADGKFGTDYLVSWNYYGSGTGYLSTHSDWGFWRDMFGGNWDTFGLAISVFAVDNLDLNIIVPLSNKSGGGKWNTSDVFVNDLCLSVSYKIPDTGEIFFTYDGANAVNPPSGGGNELTAQPEYKYEARTNGKVTASFRLTMIEGLQVQIGGGMYLAKNGEKAPITAGLGAWWDGGEFGVKVRAGYRMNNNFNENISIITVGVLPWYKLTDNITGYADIQVWQTMTKGADSVMAWYFNPSVKMGFGPGAIGIGLKIDNNGGVKIADKAVTKFSMPIRFVYSF